MEQQIPQVHNDSTGGGEAAASVAEPVRSRWTPKPEQILILESIFNSGMVNPPKDETARIRQLLEKFGPVGDANVFYWFQNRRSRSRRRQRQMQAGLSGEPRAAAAAAASSVVAQTSAGAIPHDVISSSAVPGTVLGSCSSNFPVAGVSVPGGAPLVAAASYCSSSCFVPGDGLDDLFSIARQMGFPGNDIDQPPIFSPTGASSLHNYQPDHGLMTVFINGVAQEVPSRGPIDIRSSSAVLFGRGMMLVHSSGEVVPMSECGLLFQGLQAGESYFLVSRQ